MARRPAAAEMPHEKQEDAVDSGEQLRADALDAAKEMRPEKKILPAEEIEKKQETLMQLHQEMEAASAELRDVVQGRGDKNELVNIKALNKRTNDLAKEIAILTMEIRQGAANPESIEVRSPAAMQERLTELAKKISENKNAKDTANMLREVERIIPILAKAQGVSEAGIRADFDTQAEIVTEKLNKEQDDLLLADRAAAQFRYRQEQKGWEKKKQEDELVAAQAEREYQKKKQWLDGEPARKAKFMERVAESRAAKEKLLEASNALGSVDLADAQASAEAWNTFSRSVENVATATHEKDPQKILNMKEVALNNVVALWRKRLENTRGSSNKAKTQRQDLREVIAHPENLERISIARTKTTKASSTIDDGPSFEDIRKAAAERSISPEERLKKSIRKNLENRKNEREMYQALYEEMRHITEQKDTKAMAAFYESLKRLAADEKNPEQAAAAKLLHELSTETATVARQKKEAERKEEERAPLSEEITNAMSRAEADYFREQSKGPLTREEMRAAGLSGSESKAGWRSAEERKQAMEKREALMKQLNATNWKFWQAPRLRRQIAEIDRNEAAFQSNINSRMPKRSMRNPRGSNTTDRPIHGLFPFPRL
jgi:hypothetical protein